MKILVLIVGLQLKVFAINEGRSRAAHLADVGQIIVQEIIRDVLVEIGVAVGAKSTDRVGRVLIVGLELVSDDGELSPRPVQLTVSNELPVSERRRRGLIVLPRRGKRHVLLPYGMQRTVLRNNAAASGLSQHALSIDVICFKAG